MRTKYKYTKRKHTDIRRFGTDRIDKMLDDVTARYDSDEDKDSCMMSAGNSVLNENSELKLFSPPSNFSSALVTEMTYRHDPRQTNR